MLPKFRAWDKERLNLHEVVNIFLTHSGHVAVYDEDEIGVLFDNYVLMQSTGLTDLSGVAIFEGDVVKHTDDEFSYVGVVTQDSSTCWWIKGINPDDNFQFKDIADYRDYTCDLEVIGNIYENRDLLEVSK